ncbi:hypothetical protein GCM10027589_21460 [Actinocorallia lasiicapitis]
MVTHAVGRSASDVWITTDGDGENNGDPAVLHWNGKKWSVAREFTGSPSGLVVRGKGDVHVYVTGSSSTSRWALRKGRWTRTGIPKETFSAMAETPGRDGWALAARGTGATRLLHRDRSAWKTVPLGGMPTVPACETSYPCGDVQLYELTARTSTVWLSGEIRLQTSPSDGGTGLWAAGRTATGRLAAAHVTAQGTWSRPIPLPVKGGRINALAPALAYVPSTKTLWLAALPLPGRAAQGIWTLKTPAAIR